MAEWVKTPGGLAGITKGSGGGVYARSADGRARVYVHRYRKKGVKEYLYAFSAALGGRDVELPLTARSNPTKIMAHLDRVLFREAAHGRLGGRT